MPILCILRRKETYPGWFALNVVEQSSLLVQMQVALRMQALLLSSIVTFRYCDVTLQVAFSVPVCCYAPADKHEKVVFGGRTTTAIMTQTLSADLETMQKNARHYWKTQR